MNRVMLKSKIHRATVTGADLEYQGSLAVDEALLEAADILVGEQVHVWNLTNGERFTTYAIRAERGSGTLLVNGAAAHRAQAGDLVIVATFVHLSDEEARVREPRVVFVDEHNAAIPAPA